MNSLLRITDRWFRVWGVAALVALVATGFSLVTHWAAWRVPFVAAHLATLLALVPLGLVLIARECLTAYHVAGSSVGTPGAIARRHPWVLLLLAMAIVSVAVSLANFADGTRWLRTIANLVTVAIALTLVARYLRSARVSTI